LGAGEEGRAIGIMFTEGLDRNALRWVREVSSTNSIPFFFFF